jgi:tRNA 2-thiouridine synthesizing protein A
MSGTDPSGGLVPPADAVLEMVGLTEGAGASCATLTPAIRARLREMRAGQVLEVRVDDPTAREDIASWSRLTGHAIVAMREEPAGVLTFFVRKKSE